MKFPHHHISLSVPRTFSSNILGNLFSDDQNERGSSRQYLFECLHQRARLNRFLHVGCSRYKLKSMSGIQGSEIKKVRLIIV